MASVYVIVDVPAATPLTTPADVTVATVVVAEIQGFEAAAVPEPVRVVVLPTHALKVPVIVVGLGWVILTEILEILPVFDFTYMVYVPAVNPEKVESDW